MLGTKKVEQKELGGIILDKHLELYECNDKNIDFHFDSDMMRNFIVNNIDNFRITDRL